jgi:hypothetical protein
MKSIKATSILTAVINLAVLSGCATTNPKTVEQLHSHGLIESKDQAVYIKGGPNFVCTNNNDDSFNINATNIKEDKYPTLDWVPIVSMVTGYIKEETKYQTIWYNGESHYYSHLGVIKIENQDTDVYKDNYRFTENDGKLIYIYSDSNNGLHAFSTETGVIPKLSSFYSCK